MPNEGDCVMKDWWQMTSLWISQSFMFLFCHRQPRPCLWFTYDVSVLHYVLSHLRECMKQTTSGPPVIFLAWRPHCFANFSLFVFCWGKLLTTTETTVAWTRISWFLTWCHNPFRNPDPSLLWLTVGVAEAGTLKLDLRALKSQNPINFLRIPFYTL